MSDEAAFEQLLSVLIQVFTTLITFVAPLFQAGLLALLF